MGNNCTWNNTTLRDANNQLYNPDERLYMAYTYPQCMTIFTNGQITRMNMHLATSAILQPRIIASEIFVQNETFSNGQSTIRATNRIVAGTNVTTGTQGNVTVNNSANVEFRAVNHVGLMPGVIIQPNTNGSFIARIVNQQSLKTTVLTKQRDIVDTASPLFFDNSKWVSISQGFEGNITSELEIVGDTLVDSLLYFKILETYIKPSKANNNPFVEGNGMVYYLREDMANKKVWQLTQDGTEDLWYDFDLSLNDGLPTNGSYKLVSIDSVEISAGKRKRFLFRNENNSKIIWIEGLGNISSPFIPRALYGEHQKLVCSFENEKLIYDDDQLVDFDCTTYRNQIQVVSNVEGLGYTITPNPNKGLFRVFSNSENRITSVKIIDLTGQVVADIGKIDHLRYLDLDISSLSNGMYLSVVYSDDKLEAIKFFKE